MVKVALGKETSILSLAETMAATSKAIWMVRESQKLRPEQKSLI